MALSIALVLVAIVPVGTCRYDSNSAHGIRRKFIDNSIFFLTLFSLLLYFNLTASAFSILTLCLSFVWSMKLERLKP